MISENLSQSFLGSLTFQKEKDLNWGRNNSNFYSALFLKSVAAIAKCNAKDLAKICSSRLESRDNHFTKISIV